MAAERMEKWLKRRMLTWGSLIVLLHGAIGADVSGATLAFWDFNSIPPDASATTGTLQPAAGSGTASLVGGVTGSFTAPNGSSDPNSTDNSNWRITNWPAQGTQNKQNGVRFDVSTAGFQTLTVVWDLRTSSTASRYTRLQYTTNGTDFIDFQLVTMPSETWVNSQTASFSGVPGADNNPSFGIRFVTEFESTAIGSTNGNYVPCDLTTTYGSVGTLRFDMISFLASLRPVTNFTVLTYNTFGRHITDWTTNSAQVQAIGRQMSSLKPDIIGFQEIPEVNAGFTQMTNFVTAFLPGYYVATSPSLDNVERFVVVSRFPFTRSKSWLVNSSLSAFGYSGTFDRGLFEAQISVPGFSQPFHYFVTHPQAGSDQDSATRRGAEAGAISNYFVTIYLSTNSLHPYCLVGDMNEDVYRPRDYELQAIQTMTSPTTGLWLTTPTNPVTGDDRTWSIQNSDLTIRFDYVLPSTILSTNVMGGQVFRSDKVSPTAPPMLTTDSATASDHLPVLLMFHNPYVGRLDQTISFGALADKVYGNSPFTVSATASSGLPVSFNIQSGPATINGNTVTITGGGTVTVRATQPGNTFYNPAAPVDQSFTVNKAGQIITFGALAARTYGDSPFSVSATASSGLPVGFSIQSGPATVNGNTVTLAGAGNVVVRATQPGNANYNAAFPVDRSFTVSKANSSTVLASSQNPSCFGSVVTLTATVTGVSPGGNVQFLDGAGLLGTAALANGQALLQVSALSPGTHANLTAQYAGDVNHNSSVSGGYAQVVAEGPLKWAGGDGDWTSAVAGAWRDKGSNSVRYCDSYQVILDDTAVGISPITITVNSAISPASVTVSNSLKDYVISGSAGIAGASTTLTKQGAGTLVLNGTNTCGGGVFVSAGSLRVNGATGGGMLTVGTGGMLGGTGTITGTLVVQSGGTLMPGNSIGTLTASGNVTLGSGSLTIVELNRNALPSADRLQGVGLLTEGSTLQVNNLGAGLQINDSFLLFSATTYRGQFELINPASPNNDPELAWDKPALMTNGILRVHHTPYATNTLVSRNKGAPVSISLIDLFPTPDPLDGDGVMLQSLTSGSQGATITSDAFSILYSPANDNDDSFDYTVTDARGGQRTATVNVKVLNSLGSVTITNIGTGEITIAFAGTPGYDYVVQRSSNLVNWVSLATNTAPASGPDTGRIQYTETPPHNPAYYRVSGP